MSTFLQMRNRIANYINRSDLTTEINDAITRAIEFYEKERFYFQETTGTFSTIADQESYGTADSIPTDIKEIDQVIITLSSTNKQPLIRRTYDYIKNVNIGQSTGDPIDYAWYASKFWFYPIPDSVKTITLSYKKSYTALSADADTNDWTTKAEDLIENHALFTVYSQVLKDKEEANDAMSRVTNLYLPALRTKSNQLQSSGMVSATSF
jgi:hypothetical protein